MGPLEYVVSPTRGQINGDVDKMAIPTGLSAHATLGTQWFALSKAAGLKLLEHNIQVRPCLDRVGVEISWTGANGKRYSHIIHEMVERPGGFRQDVVNEFKVKVAMSLA